MPSSPPDPSRRRFFRQFAGEIATSAGQLAGAVRTLREDSLREARGILGDDAATGGPGGRGRPGQAAPESAPSGFRTPFRFAPDDDHVLLLIDQRELPDRLVEFRVTNANTAARAIRDMVVRGAPAIGQVAAIGLALTAHLMRSAAPHVRRTVIEGAARTLAGARPTAVNLGWAVERLRGRFAPLLAADADGETVARDLRAEAEAIVAEATDDHGRLAEAGLALLPRPAEGRPLNVLTHCNTGPLACGQYGTALGIVQAAHHAELPLHVWVDETRPYLQGARLTAWELAQAGVPHTLIADVAAGGLIARGEVDLILVGADRIAANGDTANKVGTYPLAVVAARHGVPFYVCAPTSSIDAATPDGSAIPIEDRAPLEVLQFRGTRVAPAGTRVRNPSFDVTPAELITAIVTEEGVLRPPFGDAIARALETRAARRAGASRRDPSRRDPSRPDPDRAVDA
jgi:methylthioribose-1-phosphate isomerase